MVQAVALTAVMVLTIAVGVTAALLAWRERAEPGALPLMLLLGGQSFWSVSFVLQLQASTLSAKMFWSDIQWVGVVVIPVAWLLFSLEYTGRDNYVRPEYVAALMAIPAITIVLALTGDFHALLYLESRLVETGGLMLLSRVGGPWYWIITAYTYLLAAIGAIPLLELVRSEARFFRIQSVSILIGVFSPAAINVAFLVGLIPIPGLDPTPVGFTISGVAFLVAVRRFRLFRTSPAPTEGAHRLVFERMQEGAVVVDSHDYIVDMNDNAAAIFDRDPGELLGQHAPEVIPLYETLAEAGQADEYLTIEGAEGTGHYDVNVTSVEDYHGRIIGKVFTFHDIGQHLQQQQRLEVLNRVLRHNIKTETNLIYGYLERVSENGDRAVSQVREHAERIEDLSEQARTVAELLDSEDGEGRAAPLRLLVEDAIEAVRAEHPEVEIEYRDVGPAVEVSAVLGPVIENLLDNAARHNPSETPWVGIGWTVEDGRVRLTVEDDGPGIEPDEREVLHRGRETQLEHGSGLGLWLIKWGTRIAGGEVTIRDVEPTGTAVTVSVPVLASDGEAPPGREPAVQ